LHGYAAVTCDPDHVRGKLEEPVAKKGSGMTPWAWLAAGAICVGVIVASAVIIGTRQARELSRVAGGHPQARSWLAIAENASHTSVFTVDRTSVSLLTRQGVLERTWPMEELRRVSETRLRIGLLDRAGLRLEFASHATGNALAVGFPVLGGLTISAAKAAEVKARILEAQQGHGTFEPT
jgi:hypothetical protein